MKTATLSIRLDAIWIVFSQGQPAGRTQSSEVARDALRRQLRLTQFEAIADG